MHHIKRTVALASAAVFIAASVSATGAVANGVPTHNDTQTIRVDSRSLLSTKSSNDLRNGVFYVATVSGTVSYYAQSVWTTPRRARVICGSTSAIMHPSPGQAAGVGGVDAQTLFAGPATRGCGIPKTPFHWGNFQISLNGYSFSSMDPIGGARSTPTADHTYTYVLKGRGTEARFRFSDVRHSDNNGVLVVQVRRAATSDCRNGGWSSFGEFRSERDCISSLNAGH
jgi:hypothetical protein